MEGVVNLYNDQVDWYHAYGNDAKVISNIIGYKLYKIKDAIPAVGFPTYVLDKVAYRLKIHDISYGINGRIVYNCPNSEYNKFLNKKVTQQTFFYDYGPTIDNIKLYKEITIGTFTIKYNDEDSEQSYEIGQNINPEAGIINFVEKHSIGDIDEYNDYKIQIINKDLKKTSVEIEDNIYKYGKYVCKIKDQNNEIK